MVNIKGNELLPEINKGIAAIEINSFMQEHADYERKSSEYALAIIGKFNDKTLAIASLAHIALGALTIFTELHSLMQHRGVLLIPEVPQNLYLKQLGWLSRTGREERFIDRLLLGSIAESRCATRFKQVSEAVEEDMELSLFYSNCSKLKSQAADRYMEIAYGTADAEIINQRYEALKLEEEKVMFQLQGSMGIF